MLLGDHLIKSWSSTQPVISLSSGEAEFYGAARASAIGLGYQAMLHDLGVELPLRVWTDSTATTGICGRQGLGKLRHVDIQCLWIQQRVRDGTVEPRKVLGTDNPADLMTKYLTRSVMGTHFGFLNQRRESGRAKSGLNIQGNDRNNTGKHLPLPEMFSQHVWSMIG